MATQQSRCLIGCDTAQLGCLGAPYRAVLRDVGEDHLFLLDWIEAAGTNVGCGFADLSVQRGHQVICASSAFATGFQQLALDERIEYQPSVVGTDV